MHEFGHALGLEHPGDYDAGDGSEITYANDRDYHQDTAMFSIMSYFEASNYNSLAILSRSEILTPMIYDILAVQAYYGVDTTRLGSTTYGFNSTANRAVFTFDIKAATPVFTIWDAGGERDRIDASQYSQTQRIDLSEGSLSDIGGLVANIGISFNTFIEDAIGGTGNDLIDGNAAGNLLDGGGGSGDHRLFGKDGADTLIGGDGNDILYGEAGNDTLFGGAGADLLNGGASFDTAEYSAASGENITIRPLTDNPSMGRWSIIGAAQATGDILAQIEAFRFGEGTDNISTQGATVAFGFNLDGRGGNDTIRGGPGTDTLIGGLGHDDLRPGGGVFHVFGGVVNGPTDQMAAQTLAQNDVLVLDRSGTTTNYGLTVGGFDGGSFIVADGSTARGIARLDYTGGSGVDAVGGGLGNDLMNPLIFDPPPGVIDFERAGRDSLVAFISMDGGR